MTDDAEQQVQLWKRRERGWMLGILAWTVILTAVLVVDPMDVPLGEDHEDHLVSIPVCLEHMEALEQYLGGKNVREVDVR